MIRISALNTDSSASSDSDEDSPRVTKEAQEEITLSKYNRALQYQRKNEIDKALYVLREITETDLPKLLNIDNKDKSKIIKSTPPSSRDGTTSIKFINLKYSCHRNIGLLFYKKGLKSIALDYYLDAALIDGTDVTLWHRIGKVAIEVKDYQLAVEAFQKGLECNPKHWPCLDQVIMLLYAMREDVSALYFISKAFQLEPDYIRGLAIRHQLYKYNKAIKEYYYILYKDLVAFDPPLDVEFDQVEGKRLIEESEIIAEEVLKQIKANEPPFIPPTIKINKPLEEYTWVAVGKSILDMHQYINDNKLSFFNPIELNKNINEEKEEEKPEMKVEKEENVVEICKEVLNEIIDQIESGINEDGEKKVEVKSEKWKNQLIDKLINNYKESSNDAAVLMDVEENGCESSIIEIQDDDAMDFQEVPQQVIPDEIDELVKITSELEKSGDISNSIIDENVNHHSLPQSETKIIPPDSHIDLILAAETSSCPKTFEKLPQKKLETATTDQKSPENQQVIKIPDNETSEDDNKGVKDDGTDKEEGRSATDTDGLSATEDPKPPTSTTVAKSKVSMNKQQYRRRRSSLSMLEIWGWHSSKRKSSRASQNENVKKKPRRERERDDTIRGALKRILPETLYSKTTLNTETETRKPSDGSSETEEENVKEEDYFGTASELNDVTIFWNKFANCDNVDINNRCDILTLIEYYCEAIATKWLLKWPEELISIFINLYEIYRLYFHHPSILDVNIPFDKLEKDAQISLLYGELLMDHQSIKKSLPLETEAQIWLVACKPLEWKNNFVIMFCRVFYLKTLLAINERRNNDAMDTLRTLIFELEERGYDDSLKINLSNCQSNNKINIKQLKAYLQSLERYENLSKLVDLFDSKKFDCIIRILKETFEVEQVENIASLDSAPGGADRPLQIILLLDSLWFKKEYVDCLNWSQKGLNESLIKYIQLKTDDTNDDQLKRWHTVILKCLAIMENIVNEQGVFILHLLDNEILQRLVETLAHLVCHQIESEDQHSTTDMPFNTISAWILLHHILQREEDKGHIKMALSTDRKSASGSDDDYDDDATDEEIIPPSLMILFVAHEYLGHRNWCSFDKGSLLLFTLDVIMPRLRSPFLTSIRDKISQHIEQIFYCLYQHPSKKNNKLRYLLDHNVLPQKLSWERAQQLYDFYRPDFIPEFDAYKFDSISSDTEGLLKRIVHLIPIENEPKPLEINAYLDGERNEMPDLPQSLPNKIKGIYYLLADFYFKNNEFAKAFKYYTLDLYNNPKRIDSWAGMALSRASLMETTINSCEPINDTEFLATARTVQICFKQSLDINPNRSMLWIEYGAFVYSMHSFCSRIMKTEAETLSMEKFEVLENKKEEFLKCALECFIAADEIWQHLVERNETPDQDERWLHQYMQGKIAEKQGKDPNIYMTHYMKSRELLNENNAQYPQKINYNNPQKLAVEALEVYYRIHASILKYMELHESKPIYQKDAGVFYTCLNECADNGFIKPTTPPPTPAIVEDKSKKSTDDESATSNLGKRPIINETPPPGVDTIKKSKVENEAAGESKPEDAQTIMDRLMKQCMDEHSQHSGGLEYGSEESATTAATDEQQKEGEIAKKKVEEGVKITNGEATKQDEVMEVDNAVARRESHESTTTTTTVSGGRDEEEEANGSDSSSSSSGSGSSSGSSGSSSSSSSSSESSDDDSDTTSKHSKTSSKVSRASKASKRSNSVDAKTVALTDSQIDKLVTECLKSLELCVTRFPQHYKALYRLAYYHFHRPEQTRNLTKCRQLLLGQYKCMDETIIQGLFSDRKSNNFFNGVWRIPVSEMDRPGSFASHMSRCVTLLMQVLRASNDHRTLLELCLQLKRTPDPEKKYLRELEREQLSQQALSLCLQCLRELLRALTCNKYILTHSSGINLILNEPPTQQQQVEAMGTAINLDHMNPASQLLLDTYRAYQKALKNLSHKEGLFAQVLCDVFKQHSPLPNESSSYTLEQTIKFCQQRIAANRLASQQANLQSGSSATGSLTSLAYGPATQLFNQHQMGANIQSHHQLSTSQRSKPSKSVTITQQIPQNIPSSLSSTSASSSLLWGSSRGTQRGRPPNINTTTSSKIKYPTPPTSSSNMSSTTTPSPYYPFHPLLMNASAAATPLSKMDPQSAALSLMMRNYQELMRQYQSTIPNYTPERACQDLAQTLLQMTQSSPLMAQLSNLTNPVGNPPKTNYNKMGGGKKVESKKVPNKASIIKAVYGGKEKVPSKPVKDRPFLSISQVPATVSIPPTSPGKTLQQKLAEKQKQISKPKDLSSPVSLYQQPAQSSSTYISPPPAHVTKINTIPYQQYPITAAHSNSERILQLPAAISITKKSSSGFGGEQTIPLLPKLPQISASVVPTNVSHASPILTNLPPSVSIAPISNAAKSQTSKLITYRKQSAKSVSVKKVTPVPAVPPKRPVDNSEIIVLDDD